MAHSGKAASSPPAIEKASNPLILWLNGIGAEDISRVGGKVSQLLSLAHSKVCQSGRDVQESQHQRR